MAICRCRALAGIYHLKVFARWRLRRRAPGRHQRIFSQLRRAISGIKQYAKYFYNCWPDRGQYRHVQVSCVSSL